MVAGQADLTVGFWGEMQRLKPGTQWDWTLRRGHLELMCAVLWHRISSPLLSVYDCASDSIFSSNLRSYSWPITKNSPLNPHYLLFPYRALIASTNASSTPTLKPTTQVPKRSLRVVVTWGPREDLWPSRQWQRCDGDSFYKDQAAPFRGNIPGLADALVSHPQIPCAGNLKNKLPHSCWYHKSPLSMDFFILHSGSAEWFTGDLVTYSLCHCYAPVRNMRNSLTIVFRLHCQTWWFFHSQPPRICS